jgi:hypothetical protein
MKPVSRSSRILACTLLVSLVAACGGGGGESAPAPAPNATAVPTPPPPAAQVLYTAADAQNVARLGFNIAELMYGQSRREMASPAYFAKDIIDESVFGQTAFQNIPLTSLPCAATTTASPTTPVGSGTHSFSVTKAANTVGLQNGDSFVLAYQNCDFGDGASALSGNVRNGTLTATVQGNYSVLNSAGFTFSYKLTTENLQQTPGIIRVSSTGSNSVTVVVNGASGGVNGPEYYYPSITSSVVGNYVVKYFNPANSTTAGLIHNWDNGMTLRNSTGSNNSFTSKIDGTMSSVVGNNSLALTFNTPTQLSGAYASGRPVPSTGVMRVTQPILLPYLLTETTVSGVNAVIKADSDRNGSLDLTVNTTYNTLVN